MMLHSGIYLTNLHCMYLQICQRVISIHSFTQRSQWSCLSYQTTSVNSGKNCTKTELMLVCFTQDILKIQIQELSRLNWGVTAQDTYAVFFNLPGSVVFPEEASVMLVNGTLVVLFIGRPESV